MAPRIGIERRPIDLFNGNTRFASLNVYDAQAGVDVGSQFGKYGELRFGMMRGNLHYNVDTGQTVLPQAGVNIGKGGFTGHLYLDQLDSWNFPRDGYGGNLTLLASRQSLGAQDDYNRWSADFVSAHSVGRHTLLLGVRAGGAIGRNPLPIYDQFQFGGLQQLSGYRTGQFFGESVQFASLTYMNKLANAPFLEGAYAGFSLEAGKVGHQLIGGSPGGVVKSMSVFVALDSPLGPLYLAYGRALDGNSSYYLFLGRP
ncbi:BamA/TamA family outer membrane protein [Undibacterium arcticum]|uniref:BamA/TamA family outer membrane protein n=1 Tax=Undibacterium arcticum TaxID=1762892 RepID=A0ABV7F9C2_9BURK